MKENSKRVLVNICVPFMIFVSNTNASEKVDSITIYSVPFSMQLHFPITAKNIKSNTFAEKILVTDKFFLAYLSHLVQKNNSKEDTSNSDDAVIYINVQIYGNCIYNVSFDRFLDSMYLNGKKSKFDKELFSLIYSKLPENQQKDIDFVRWSKASHIMDKK